MDRDAERLDTIAPMIDDIGRRLVGLTFAQFVDDGDERDLIALNQQRAG